MYLLMLPCDYINSELLVNSHPECFAGSAAGLGCLWAFLTPPGLFFYSCYAWRSNTKQRKSRLSLSTSTSSFNTSHCDITGFTTDPERTQKKKWHSNPKKASIFLPHRKERSISIIVGACLPSWIVGGNWWSSYAVFTASCWHLLLQLT